MKPLLKTPRVFITGLCAVVAFFLMLAAIWQSQEIRRLRAEQAVLRQDLRSALATGLENVPVGDHAERERLELIKLRNETRDLREKLVEARAVQPTGLKGIIQPLLQQATAAPQLAPEWKGLEKNLTNNYTQAMSGVNNGTNELVRYLYLARAAKLSLAMGRKEDARRFAEDAMALNEKYSRGSTDKSNGDVVHDANLVLGRLAVEAGRLDDAKRHLLAAGRTGGSPGLNSFGPNMSLAKDLLERGEHPTVLQYFELCRKFWSYQSDKLDEWKRDVEAGRIPDFKANLIF